MNIEDIKEYYLNKLIDKKNMEYNIVEEDIYIDITMNLKSKIKYSINLKIYDMEKALKKYDKIKDESFRNKISIPELNLKLNFTISRDELIESIKLNNSTNLNHIRVIGILNNTKRDKFLEGYLYSVEIGQNKSLIKNIKYMNDLHSLI